MSGETAWAKRTQGICQPAGSLARSQELIQPRKRLDVKDDLVTSRGSQHRHSAQRQADDGFTGVYQDCGMVEEKRTQTDPRPPEQGAGLPRTREACAPLLLGNWQVTDDQCKEDIRESVQESDPFILLRDGRADHMGKEWAGSQRGQSTDTRGRNAPKRSVSSSLSALSRKAARAPKHRFRALYRLIDMQMLYESFHALQRKAAPGVDGLTVGEYERHLDENLRSLLERLIGRRYRAQPVRRRYIEKPGSSKLRPLGIPALEDKIVQHAASRILESIYESDFSERSVGYRRSKPGARQCGHQLARELYSGIYRWVVDADIRSFFDDVDHEWLVCMLEQRIADRAFVGLIVKWLKAGVLEAEGEGLQASEAGTPQGGIISPILANIYLHFVLDLWLERKLRKEFQGRYLFMRYADDLVVCFEWKSDAVDFLRQLGGRLGKFSLKLAEEKSGLVKFNRWEPDRSGKFTFLGFDFYWARCRNNRNHMQVKRKTAKKKFRAALASLRAWMIAHRHQPLRWVLERLRAKFRGHGNYYGVIGNASMLGRYFHAATKIVFKWLNRRSQRRSFTWGSFQQHWYGDWNIPAPRVVETNEFRNRASRQLEIAMP